MPPIDEKDRDEIEKIAETARRKARTCPLCRSEDSVFRGKCQSCGAVCKEGVWTVPPARAPEPQPPAPPAPEPKPVIKEEWNPLMDI